MDLLLHDVRFALRSLARNRTFTAAAVLTLALGIGANSAIFSIVNAVLMRPLPFANAERLYLLWGDRPSSGYDQLPLSLPNFTDVRARARGFDQMAAWTSFADTRFSLTGEGEPEKVQYAVASANLFGLLGTEPEIGRGFQAADDSSGRAEGVIVSHALWQRRFGSARSTNGVSLVLDGRSYPVIGVLPADFRFVRFPREPEVWLPFGLDPFPDRRYARGMAGLGVIARLAPGMTEDVARRDLRQIAGSLAAEYPRFNTGWSLQMISLREQSVGPLRAPLLIMFGAVGLVLLIACSNVANLLLARASTRRREIAIRTALGATRARLTMQLLIESVLLAVLGGGLGLALATWIIEIPAAVSLAGPSPFVPYAVARDAVSIDWSVLAFTLAVSVVTGIVFGLLPALRASGLSLSHTLRAGLGAGADDPGKARMRRGLVVAQIAISLILVSGAGLLLQAFARLQRTDPGFRSDHVVTADLNLPASRYENARAREFFEALLARLEHAPGVTAAGVVEQLPLSGPTQSTDFRIIGAPEPAPGQAPQAEYGSVTPGYFTALRIPIVRGRALGTTDDARSSRVALVNEAMARRFWPGEDPIGKRVALSVEALRFDRPNAPPRLDFIDAAREVVGVVGDVRQAGLSEAARPAMYVPLSQAPARDVTLVIRSATDPMHVADLLRSAVHALDPSQPVSGVATLDGLVSASIAQPRSRTVMLGAFAMVAMLLASVGVYGLVSYGVARRTRELGVRIALGAERRDVLALVLREGMLLAVVGSVVGAAGAWASGRALSSMLVGVDPRDPTSVIVATIIVLGVAAVASYVPARRASRTDPMVALREE